MIKINKVKLEQLVTHLRGKKNHLGFTHTTYHSPKEIPAELKFNYKMLFRNQYLQHMQRNYKSGKKYTMLLIVKNCHLFSN